MLHTDTKTSPLQAACRDRDLLQVENLLHRAKAILKIRPIYDSCGGVIGGHFPYSFLALMLQKELVDLSASQNLVIKWANILRDLDRLREATIEEERQAHHHLHRRHQASRLRFPGNRRDPAARLARARRLRPAGSAVGPALAFAGPDFCPICAP